VTAQPDPGVASLTHVLGRLEVVARRVGAAVERRRASDPDPGDRFRGLHISPAQVQALLAGLPASAPPDPDAGALLASVERAADSAEAAGGDLRLRRLARAFGLQELDVELLLVGLAPDLDSRFERLYGYLHDDVSRRRASVGIWLELCGLEPASVAAWRRLAAGAPLTAARLVLVEEPDRPFQTRALRVPDRVAAFLLGDDTPDPGLRHLLHDGEAEPAAGSPLARALAAGVRLAYVRERPGTAAVPLAAGALAAAGLGALALDLRRLRPDDDVPALAAVAAREAALLGAGLVAGPLDALAARDPAAVRALGELPATVALHGAGSWDPAWSARVPYRCDARPPGHEERERLWRTELDGQAATGLDPAAATGPFRLTAEQLRRAAEAARLQARAGGRPVEADDLRAGARAQNAAGLERLASRIEPAVGFDDLVLPAEVLEQLRDLTLRARHRDLVLGRWAMAGASSRRRGLTALFAGASGTGKTMAAEVLAREMGLDLYVVDLASVVDKYVGETEKNLDRIFAEAESVNGVLLFDEADALFGKRSDVSDAHDRYANVEVAYLLQRMELFEGIAILATNLRSNLDEAFARRLDALIDFPEPEAEDRLRLWRRCLGTTAPREPDLDLEFLARAFKLSGGNVRNVVVAAAYAAAEEGRPISMAHLVRATRGEYRKLGRMVVESEFGRYYPLLGPAASRQA
jgi:winged helix domain-containing protein/ATPase family protein associated with various cellular activities (AAA)